MASRYTLDMLKGCELREVGHCANLFGWYFYGRDQVYALHTQCSYRIVYNGVVILTDAYLYYKNPEDQDNDATTLWDHQYEKNVISLLPLTVEKIECNPLNDLFIFTRQGVRIESFGNQPEEQWRLFAPNALPNVPHLVAYFQNVSYE